MEIFEYPYSRRAGGTTTAAITRTLDSTSLTHTEVLLREAVQNSYDAKLNNDKPLELYFNCFRFEKQQIKDIQKLIGKDGLNKEGEKLVQKIYSSSYNLEIADRNSTGLSGKGGFQEDRHSGMEEKFHHFIYMTGNDDNKVDSSGGSFGFGKAALYKYSGLRTIAVYTRVLNEGKYETRFILCRIDERIKEDCGRCWWGAVGRYKDKTEYAAPLLNEDADNAAVCFNMKPFAEEETGTDVLLLDVSGHKDLQEWMPNCTFENTFKDFFPELILHWFWPKTSCPNPAKQINFHMTFEKQDCSDRLLAPEDYYPYKFFAKSLKKFYEFGDYSAANVDEENGIFALEAKSPKQDIGRIILQKCNIHDGELKYKEFIFSEPTVVWMRDVEFIVKYYHPAPQNLKEGKTVFGIFHTNPELEQYFRTFENQTHDEWNFKKQTKEDGYERDYTHNYIRLVGPAIDQAIKKYCGVSDKIESGSNVSPGIAEQLGKFLGFGYRGGSSFEPKDPTVSRRSGGGGKRPAFRRTNSAPDLVYEDGRKVILIDYEAANITKPQTISLVPYLKSNDKEKTIEMAGDNELKIVGAVFKNQDVAVEKSEEKKCYLMEIEDNGKYQIKIEYGVQCSFDIKSEIVTEK